MISAYSSRYSLFRCWIFFIICFLCTSYVVLFVIHLIAVVFIFLCFFRIIVAASHTCMSWSVVLRIVSFLICVFPILLDVKYHYKLGSFYVMQADFPIILPTLLFCFHYYLCDLYYQFSFMLSARWFHPTFLFPSILLCSPLYASA